MFEKSRYSLPSLIRRLRISLLILVFSISWAPPDALAAEAVKDVRICLISDMNGSYGSIDLPASVHSGVSRLSGMNCDLVLGAGDLVAGQDPSLTTDRLRAMWDEWERVVSEPFLKQGIPVLSAIGNHDASAERSIGGGFIYQRERDQAARLWTSLAQRSAYEKIRWLSATEFPFNYSFQFESVGVVVFDGSAAGEPTRNRIWLENQLKTIENNSSITTRLVVGHLPLFAVAQGREAVGEILENSRSIYELLNAYKVDFYISGHHHAFYPGRPEGWPSAYGTTQLALGAIGDGPRKLLSNAALPPRTSIAVMDVNRTGETFSAFPLAKFLIRTFSPVTGEAQPISILPEWLSSRDGQANPVVLRRVDF